MILTSYPREKKARAAPWERSVVLRKLRRLAASCIRRFELREWVESTADGGASAIRERFEMRVLVAGATGAIGWMPIDSRSERTRAQCVLTGAFGGNCPHGN